VTTNVVKPEKVSAARDVDGVGAGLRIRGEISGDEDLLVEGVVEGPIHLATHKLTVGLNASVNSEVEAREIVVHGNVKGNLKASDRIEIMKDGSVIGDLKTARILIEDGARFKGSIEIDRKESATAPDTAVRARAATASGQTHPAKTT
jgi:cytoskeletal protein CcmA (bactofilin family)